MCHACFEFCNNYNFCFVNMPLQILRSLLLLYLNYNYYVKLLNDSKILKFWSNLSQLLSSYLAS